MKLFKEYKTEFLEDDGDITGKKIYETVPITIDLMHVVSFNAGYDINHTTVRMIDGSAYNLQIRYNEFKSEMNLCKRHFENILN